MASMGRPILDLIWSVLKKKEKKNRNQRKIDGEESTQTRNKIVTPVSEVPYRLSRKNQETQPDLDRVEISTDHFDYSTKITKLDEVEICSKPTSKTLTTSV